MRRRSNGVAIKKRAGGVVTGGEGCRGGSRQRRGWGEWRQKTFGNNGGGVGVGGGVCSFLGPLLYDKGRGTRGS